MSQSQTEYFKWELDEYERMAEIPEGLATLIRQIINSNPGEVFFLVSARLFTKEAEIAIEVDRLPYNIKIPDGWHYDESGFYINYDGSLSIRVLSFDEKDFNGLGYNF
jgi:hypothetical protein